LGRHFSLHHHRYSEPQDLHWVLNSHEHGQWPLKLMVGAAVHTGTQNPGDPWVGLALWRGCAYKVRFGLGGKVEGISR
jgi:hypothetical protein